MHKIDVVRALAELVTPEDLFVCAHGGLRNDWWNSRPGEANNTLFLTGMNTVSATALGLAVALPHRRVTALETDGSVLMGLSLLCTLGNERPPNLSVVVFDNTVYESIGGPPTATSGKTDLAKMAEGAGCINCSTVTDVEAFARQAKKVLTDGEFGFIVAKTAKAAVHKWPKEKQKHTDGVEEKYRFLRYVEQLEKIRIHHVVEIGG